MREASDSYIATVKSNTRRIGFRVSLKTDRSFFPEDILGISISRAISDGFQIGAAASDRLCLVTKATDRVEKGSRLVVSSYPGDDTGDTQPLGEFFADEVSTENSVTTIVAYDRMNRNLDKEVKWTHSTAPSFPCTQQQILEYLCGRKGITCNFTCQPFMVQTKPAGYTARELIGFIAACHAANAHFNADGELIFKQFTKTDAVIDRLRCYSYTAGNDDGFTVNGVLFDLGDDTQIFIDGDASEYDEDAEGIVEVFCPFASIEVAEYVWHNLGGLTYYSCSAEMPAENLLEVGDVYTATNAQGQEVQSIVLEQELSVSTDGFKETISAQAVSNSNQRATANRVSSVEKNAAEGGSGAAGTLTEYTVLSDTSIKYNGVTYTFSAGESGEITGVTTDKGGAFTPTIPGTLADVSAHNAAFMAVAMVSKLDKQLVDTLTPMCAYRYNCDKMSQDGANVVWQNQASDYIDNMIFYGASIVNDSVLVNGTSSSHGVLPFTKSGTNWTIYLVCKPLTTTAASIPMFFCGTGTNNSSITCAIWSGGQFVTDGYWGAPQTIYTGKYASTSNFTVVAYRVVDGVCADIFIDGEKISTQMTYIKPFISGSVYFAVNSTLSSSNPMYYADCAIAESLHSDTDIMANITYLMQKYNITGG